MSDVLVGVICALYKFIYKTFELLLLELQRHLRLASLVVYENIDNVFTADSWNKSSEWFVRKN